MSDTREPGEEAGPAPESDPVFPDLESLSRLKLSREPEVFAAAWLDIQCRIIGDVSQGVVILGAPDRGPFMPVAIWPEGSIGTPGLAAAIESAISTRQISTQGGGETHGGRKKERQTLACPLVVDGQICGAAAIEVSGRSEKALRRAMGQLEWGCGWLETLVHRRTFTSTDRLVTILELVATSLYHERYQEAATAVVTELAGVLACERVSIGFLHGEHVRLAALSHSATFGKKANLIQAIEAAMDESVEQQARIVYPSMEEGPLQVTRAHAALLDNHTSGTICTMPLAEEDHLLGAITMEKPKGEAFDPATIRLCEHAALLLGPLLEVKRKNDRWLIVKTWDAMKEHTRKLIGPRHVGRKIAFFVVMFVLLFSIFAQSDYRVTADATLEGTVQRVIAAPLGGYIAEANARAGDLVSKGDVLFALDARDLRLERLKWISQRSQRKSEYSEALAEHDRAQVRILDAQIDQAEAQIALLDEQLKRIRVVAPFDGVVVSGDLSQSLGAPVERGDVLFEIAPLNSYRVILNVDEREISPVAIGQQGQLVLAGQPDSKLPIVITKITPVSTAQEGNNYFRVEASLTGDDTEALRPGMEGVGKITIDRRRTVWIWTHKVTHWMKMFLWNWMP